MKSRMFSIAKKPAFICLHEYVGELNLIGLWAAIDGDRKDQMRQCVTSGRELVAPVFILPSVPLEASGALAVRGESRVA